MILSKEDSFVFGEDVEQETPVVDMGKSGDDIQHKLFLSVHAKTGSGTITWKTGDNPAQVNTVIATYTADEVTDGGFMVKNVCLPKGIKRYNKLVFSAAATGVTAALHDGRDEGTPFMGL